MAGAGYKLFNTGDVLLASEVNTYLMQQTVMIFDDASARTTALSGVVAEGMISYLKDTDAVEKYDGSSWVSLAGAASPLTTKGDLYTYSTTDARLPVGTDGYTLVADSAETTGLKWASVAAGGMTLLSSLSLSGNSSVTFSSISGSYVNLFLYVKDMTLNSGTGKFRLWFNGSFNNNDYSYVAHNTTANSGSTATPTFTYYSRAGYIIPINAALNTSYGCQLTMDLKYYVSAGQPAPLYDIIHGGSQDGFNQQVGRIWGSEMAATTVNSISIGTDSSTFAAGTAYLYGVK